MRPATPDGDSRTARPGSLINGAGGLSTRFVVAVLALSAALSAVAVTATLRKPPSERAFEAMQRGVVAFEQGDLSRAEGAFFEATTLDPTDVKALFNYGLIHQRTGRTDEARDIYRRVLNIDTRFEPALINLAILVSDTDPRQSAGLLKRLIRHNRSNAAAHFNLGLVLLKTNQDNEARRELRRAVDLDPSLEFRRRQALTASERRSNDLSDALTGSDEPADS